MRNYIYSLCCLFFSCTLLAQPKLTPELYQDSLAQLTTLKEQQAVLMRYYQKSFAQAEPILPFWRNSSFQEAADWALVNLAFAYVSMEGKEIKGKKRYLTELKAFVLEQERWAEQEAAASLPYYYFADYYLGYLENRPVLEQKERLEKALNWLEKNPDRYSEKLKFSLYKEGAYFHFGLSNEAEISLKWAKQLAKLEQPNARFVAYSLMAQIYRKKGNFERTLEALAALDGEPLPAGVQAKNLASKGICYYELGQNEQALPLLKKASQLFTELGQKNSFFALEATAYLALLDEESSSNIQLTKLLLSYGGHAQFPLLKAHIHQLKKDKNIQGLEDLANNLAQARKQGAVFRELAKNQEVYIALGQAALSLNRADLAKPYFEEAIRFQTAGLGQKEGLAQLKGQEGLAILWGIYQTQKISSAPLLEQYHSCQMAISLAKELEKQLGSKGGKAALKAQTEKVYEAFIKTAMALDQAEKNPIYIQQAFIEIELAKGSWLLSSLRNKEAQQLGKISAELLAEERSLRQDISYYQAQFSRAKRKIDSLKAQKIQAVLFQKRQALDELLSQLAQKYPSYTKWQEELKQLDIKQLKEKLKTEKYSLLTYFMGPQNSYCFLLENEEIKLFNLGPTTNLREQLQDFQQLVQQPRESLKPFKNKFIRLAHKLYQQLIPQRPKYDLLISPHAELSQLAFSCLLPKAEEKPFSRLDYLIRSYAISYLYAANFYLQPAKKTSAKGFLAMAPSYQGQGQAIDRQALDWSQARKQLQPLAGATAELDFLETHFKGQFLRQEQANEQAFRQLAPQAQFIHLAMHAITDPMAPSYSALFFSKTQDSLQDDLLLAYELPSLQLAADLVVLSACQTAAGRYQIGEGAQSLGLGFRYAGAASTLSTLWEVNDESSRLLMELFYSYLQTGQRKDKALQAAQIRYLELVDQNEVAAQPFFWAAWWLSGNSNALELPQKTNYGPFVWAAVFALFLVFGWLIYQAKK
ncbi:hypothetical protein SapgrDRAFT_2370 [Saprospira grandis DSM 2844]|uniref:CHAT domain-containing protein n=1 Tax=Saprospira grandis DSM 2844 TaxID=694433 RepID=J0XY32_9BACT|nr:CHAT domain-containing protein [Saprospira grandis]EJF54036.1 hypothetical protein SapgrDRAFT_2370 [Saprospira grandis DSM 2844]